MDRRAFNKTMIGGAMLLASSSMGGAIAAAGETSPDEGAITHPTRNSFVDRISFGPWMNDTRTEPLPFMAWPPDVFDDLTVDSIIRTFDLNQDFGYNIFDVAGFFATWGWPEDLASAATPERSARVRKVIKAAHDRNIKVIFLMGVYSWGFDTIIKNHPEVQGPNKHALCASKEASWGWQKKVVDFMMEWDIDGFHLEAADLGRCTCVECMRRWPRNPDYYNYVTSRTARYIREKKPQAYLLVTLISWADWNKGLTEQDKDALVTLSKSVDCIFDQGHHSCYVKPPERRALIDRLHCRFGTSGGLWAYPPLVWDRLQWFLPYPTQTGLHMQRLYADGGRGVMYYQGPPNNPGVEINIAFGGHLMRQVDKSVEENLSDVIESLYKPKSPADLSKLVSVILDWEKAYFGNMDWDEKHLYLKGNLAYPGPGELHLSLPITGVSGTPCYLMEPNLTTDGRKACREGFEGCLKKIDAIRDRFHATTKMDRMQSSMLNTFNMLSTVISTQQVKHT